MSFDSSLNLNLNNKDFSSIKVGVIRSLWNANITDILISSCTNQLKSNGIKSSNLIIKQVPGSMELVHGANTLLSNDAIDGVITLGCIIKGETDHDKYIASAVANGLVSVSLKYNKPVIFGVLTTNTVSQALDRCGGKYGNKGTESADTLLSILKLS
ncbi:MAG: 6,7-dimethyl-8-ribityllumazine synthase [Cytophagia bacterium]|jgi:6,7-dimethyl-8-ribityllumazine synthase|nr:6,7-dimethyl-8-ribityllumazine synthase [Cytophagia bacterium]|tara:strand:+ start:736 stop:1206 length:471 start_codon:yes stop_codon:yes gene_type:complete